MRGQATTRLFGSALCYGTRGANTVQTFIDSAQTERRPAGKTPFTEPAINVQRVEVVL